MHVLAAMPAGAERHGLDLMRDTRLPGRALYGALIRLERAGFIESRWTEAGRRAYRPTAGGLAAVAQHPAATTETRRFGWWWAAALAIAMIESYIALARPIGARLADLDVYVGAVNQLRHGTSLYDFATASGAPFTYPPFAGLALFPVTGPDVGTLRVLWTCATVATVAGLAVLVGRAGRPPRRAEVIMAVLLVSAPVSSDLRFGQVSVGLAALVALDVLGPLGRHRGVLIGLAAAVKLTPLIFIPMLWCAGRRRAAVNAAATFVTATVVTAIVLPADSSRFWTTEIWRVRRIGDLASAGNQSLTGALMRLGVGGSARTVLLLVVAGTVAALALHRARALGRHGDRLSAMVVTGAAGVALSPVSWTHHQVWIVLAAALPVRGPVWVGRAWCAAVLAVMILPVASLGGPLWSNARLVAALAVACLVPLVPNRQAPPSSAGAGDAGLGGLPWVDGSWPRVRVHGGARSGGTGRM